MAFYRLTPDYSVAPVLRRDCRSGADLGVVVERMGLLNPLALCLVIDGVWKRADVGIHPYGVVDGASVQRIPGAIL